MLETAYRPSTRVPDAFENAFRNEPRDHLHPPTKPPSSNNHLDTLGITLVENKRLQGMSVEDRLQEITQQVESYAVEVLEDKPVSTPYAYWIGPDGDLYTNPSLKEIYKAENQFDDRERDGSPRKGFRNITTRLTPEKPNEPGNVVLWYSPIGPASFNTHPENPFSKINYTDGQFYIQYFDGQKVNATAVKVTNEEIVKQFMPTVYEMAQRKQDPLERIKFFMENPHTFFGGVDAFLNHPWENGKVYKDKKGNHHYLQDVLAQVRQSLAGFKKAPITMSEQSRELLSKQYVTEQAILYAYAETIKRYMENEGVDTMSLSGSCGGALMEIRTLEQLMGIQTLPNDLVGIHSSMMRFMNQGGVSDVMYESYPCPGCGESLSGELKFDKSSWAGRKCVRCTTEIKGCAKEAA